MYRIGIIGSENSHAMAFSEIFNDSGKYDDMRVVAIFGEDAGESRKIHEKCGVELLADKAEDMLGKVDAMMVTSRNGALHAGYAMPFLKAGIPTFIDKPIANSGAEAWDMLRYARDHRAPVLGGSSMKFTEDTLALKAVAEAARAVGELYGGHVWAPVNMVNPYGDFYFYASHLIEIAMMIFGFDAKSVQAIRREKGVSVLLAYEGFTIQMSYLDGVYHYGGTVIAKDAVTTREIGFGGAYDAEAEHFAALLRTGEMAQPIEELALPVFALNAIEKAYTEGGEHAIALPK